jgi:hypothetical protein
MPMCDRTMSTNNLPTLAHYLSRDQEVARDLWNAANARWSGVHTCFKLSKNIRFDDREVIRQRWRIIVQSEQKPPITTRGLHLQFRRACSKVQFGELAIEADRQPVILPGRFGFIEKEPAIDRPPRPVQLHPPPVGIGTPRDALVSGCFRVGPLAAVSHLLDSIRPAAVARLVVAI